MACTSGARLAICLGKAILAGCRQLAAFSNSKHSCRCLSGQRLTLGAVSQTSTDGPQIAQPAGRSPVFGPASKVLDELQDFLTWQGQLLGDLLDLDAAPALG